MQCDKHKHAEQSSVLAVCLMAGVAYSGMNMAMLHQPRTATHKDFDFQVHTSHKDYTMLHKVCCQLPPTAHCRPRGSNERSFARGMAMSSLSFRGFPNSFLAGPWVEAFARPAKAAKYGLTANEDDIELPSASKSQCDGQNKLNEARPSLNTKSSSRLLVQIACLSWPWDSVVSPKLGLLLQIDGYRLRMLMSWFTGLQIIHSFGSGDGAFFSKNPTWCQQTSGPEKRSSQPRIHLLSSTSLGPNPPP